MVVVPEHLTIASERVKMTTWSALARLERGARAPKIYQCRGREVDMNFKYGPQSIAAQRLAVESIKNIANLEIATPSRSGADADLKSVLDVLREGPLPIVEVAERLNWDADKTSETLERGAQVSRLQFSRDADVMSVRIAE